MDSSLERLLAAVIEDQLDALPRPPPDLFDTIARGAVRRRRRRRLGTAIAGGAAALALAASLAMVATLRAGPTPNTDGTPSVEPSPSTGAPSATSR